MAKINRQSVYLKCDRRCGYCGNIIFDIKKMQVDHITPKWMFEDGFVKGDMNTESNLMPTCRTCNHYKRGDNLEQFRAKMMTLHERVCGHYIGKVALEYDIVILNRFKGIFYFEELKQQDNGK